MDIKNINITFDYESFSKLELGEVSSFKSIADLSIETIRSSLENFLTPLTDYVNVERYDINISCHKSFELFHKESYSIKLLIISKFSNRQSEHDIFINTIKNEDFQSIISNFIFYLDNNKFQIGYVYRYDMIKNEVESTIHGSLFLNNNEFNSFFSKYSSHFNFIKITIAGDTAIAPKILMSIYSNDKKWSGFVSYLSDDKAILKALHDIKAFHFNHDDIDKNEIVGMLETNALIGY